MDSNFTIKPTPGIVRSRALRDPVPVREAIDTDLVGGKTVTAMGEQGARDGHPRDAEQHHAPHDLVADPESQKVIYRERDVRSADHREHPDHALMRLRAYRPAPAAGDTPPVEDHADIRA